MGRDIKIALESLPEDQREVLVLRHIVGLSPTEIAGTLEKTESSLSTGCITVAAAPCAGR